MLAVPAKEPLFVVGAGVSGAVQWRLLQPGAAPAATLACQQPQDAWHLKATEPHSLLLAPAPRNYWLVPDTELTAAFP